MTRELHLMPRVRAKLLRRALPVHPAASSASEVKMQDASGAGAEAAGVDRLERVEGRPRQRAERGAGQGFFEVLGFRQPDDRAGDARKIGRASCRERVW